MTLSSVCAGPVLCNEIRMVLFSKGLSMEIKNLKEKHVLVPIKNPQAHKFLGECTPPTYVCIHKHTE